VRPTLLLLTLLVVAPAYGYTLSSPITRGCHELITSEALRTARAQTGNAAPIAPTRDEQALIDDLPSPLEADERDLGGVTLIIGITDNDLKGYSSTDEGQLVPITADPTLQREHCLRRADEDEPDGSRAALDECRAFIHERVAEALAGLDGDGRPDPSMRTTLDVYLTLRGSRTAASLPLYYVRMGQAMHALEDGFAHSYRTADQMSPTVVLNWSDLQDGTLLESRDGPAHAAALDNCDDLDALRTLRRQVATQAATELLTATLAIGASPADKLAQADAIAARYTTLQPGCTFANQWCGAPEAQLKSSATGCGCVVAARPPTSALPLLLTIVALALVTRRRLAAARALVVVLALASVASSTAHAQATNTTQPVATEPGRETPTPTKNEIEVARQKKRLGPRVGAQLTLAGSVDRAGAAAGLGLRVRITEKWLVGLDAEINPFFGLKVGAARPGVFNLYASVVRRYPMTWERVNLRTTLQAGLSTLLFDLYGAPAGSTGPYVGLSVLGLDVDLGRSLRFVFDPALVTMPIPQVTNQPFFYLQYRVSFGLSWGG
jgi:hypothetical protein